MFNGQPPQMGVKITPLSFLNIFSCLTPISLHARSNEEIVALFQKRNMELRHPDKQFFRREENGIERHNKQSSLNSSD